MTIYSGDVSMARHRRDWIHDAIKHPGALRRWVKRNARRIARITGEPPFDENGDINIRALEKLRRSKEWGRLSAHTKRMIDLAITLHILSRRRRRHHRR